jgi:hypothetical protein
MNVLRLPGTRDLGSRSLVVGDDAGGVTVPSPAVLAVVCRWFTGE